jgi:phosphodiesterase/alkaline phosphatase D-like protein
VQPTRRAVIQLAGASSLALAIGCGDNTVPEVATAVLDPDDRSVVVALWSRSSQAEVQLAVRRAGPPDGAPARAAAGLTDRMPASAVERAPEAVIDVALDRGFAAHELTALAPATDYEIEIAIAGTVVARHRVRTAPRPDDPRPVRLAISADCDPSPAFASGILEAVIATGPDLAISIGDFPYTDNGPPAVTVAAYRERHLALRNHPPVRALLEACGMWAIYDDHEFVNDWDAAAAAAEPARYAAALAVWDEFFPQRGAQRTASPDASPEAAGVRYRSWRWGAQLECFLLDCRRYRSANAAPDGAAKTMLGAEQLRWLIEGATRSTAVFKLVLTSVPLDFGRGDDHWASFATERDAMFAALVGTPGVLFVSGDQHWFAAHRHAYGIREIQIGPVARGFGTPLGSPPGVVFRAVRYNAGVIEIDGDRLTVIGLGEHGEVFYREQLTAEDLTPHVIS